VLEASLSPWGLVCLELVVFSGGARPPHPPPPRLDVLPSVPRQHLHSIVLMLAFLIVIFLPILPVSQISSRQALIDGSLGSYAQIG
jgi:hypothetical protein